MGICPSKTENINENELNISISHSNHMTTENQELNVAKAIKNDNLSKPVIENDTKNSNFNYIEEMLILFNERIKDYGKISNEEKMQSKTLKIVLDIEQKRNELLKTYLFDFNDYNKNQLFYKGVIHFDDDTYYNGTWNFNLKKHGKGIFIKSDGSKYCGEFCDDKIQGNGYYIDLKGNLYIGQFKNEQANGEGEIIHNEVEGYISKGNFQNNKLHGFGIEKLPNGTVYEGEFNMGEKEGKGKLTFSDQSYYEGEFKKSDISGKGIYKWSDGKIYEGNFLNNKIHGKGKTIWPDGSYYEGEYKYDQREGKGTHYIPNNKFFIGYWMNSLFHGVGIYRENDIEYRGIWRYGKKIKDL